MDSFNKKVLCHFFKNHIQNVFNYVDGMNFGDNDGIFQNRRKEKCLIKCLNDKHMIEFGCIPFYDFKHANVILKFDEMNKTK